MESVNDIKTVADGWNALAKQVHADNVAKGFWPDNVHDRNVGEALMLVVSEIAEAHEGTITQWADEKVPEFQEFDVEIGDAMIRVMDLASAHDIDLETVNESFMPNLDRFTDIDSDLNVVVKAAVAALEGHRKNDATRFYVGIQGLFYALLAVCEKYAVDMACIDAKLAYNRSRPFKHGKSY